MRRHGLASICSDVLPFSFSKMFLMFMRRLCSYTMIDVVGQFLGSFWQLRAQCWQIK